MTREELMKNVERLADEYMAAMNIYDAHTRYMMRAAYITGLLAACNRLK